MRRFVAPVLAALLSACATMHGPRSITLSTAEIESHIQADLGGVVEMFKGLDAGPPEVSLMPAAGRLLLEWQFRLPDGPAGSPLGIGVEVSGTPVLNAGRNGIDLAQVRIDDVRIAGLPRFLGFSRLGERKGTTLPDLPLMTLPADLLRRSDVAYEATGVSVGFAGLTVEIAPR